MTKFDSFWYCQRIEYYCVKCEKLRLGPLPSEANNLSIPCICGSSHFSTDIRDIHKA